MARSLTTGTRAPARTCTTRNNMPSMFLSKDLEGIGVCPCKSKNTHFISVIHKHQSSKKNKKAIHFSYWFYSLSKKIIIKLINQPHQIIKNSKYHDFSIVYVGVAEWGVEDLQSNLHSLRRHLYLLDNQRLFPASYTTAAAYIQPYIQVKEPMNCLAETPWIEWKIQIQKDPNYR